MNYYSRQDFLSLNMSTAFHQDAQGRALNGEEVSRTSLVGGVEGHGDCSPLSFRAMLRGSVTG